MAHPGGRPSLYEDRFCEMVIEHCKDGKSLTSFAASIGVCRDTIQEWRNVHDRFSLSCKKALALAQAHWEETLKKCVNGEVVDVIPLNNMNVHVQKHNVTALIFLMKSRFMEYKEDYIEADPKLPFNPLTSFSNDG